MPLKPRITVETVRCACPELAAIEFLDVGGQSDVRKVVVHGRTEILPVPVKAAEASHVQRERCRSSEDNRALSG